MDEIHCRLPDGQWIVGVEFFHQPYIAVGFGLLVWPTRLPGISRALKLVAQVLLQPDQNFVPTQWAGCEGWIARRGFNAAARVV